MEGVPGQVLAATGESSASGVWHTVAVVDDDPGLRHALTAWLAYHEMHATEYVSGESLLERAQCRNGQWFIVAAGAKAARLSGVVLDVNLPGISGIEVARRLRAGCPALPLVMLTALPADDLGRYGVLPEAVTCLRKPFDLAALEAALFSQSGFHARSS